MGNREPCFYAGDDYHCYLHWLHKSAADWHFAIYPYPYSSYLYLPVIGSYNQYIGDRRRQSQTSYPCGSKQVLQLLLENRQV